MGSEDLFYRRKAKQANELRRKRERRAAYDKVLIVCEGEKTEPNYFRELRNHYRLNTTNVEISGDCGSAPISVVEHAKRCYRDEQRKGLPFDRVYCVFDKDTHDSYQTALRAVAIAKPKGTFYGITSVPCFEFWLLLHFVYTTKPFYGTVGSRSGGDQVTAELCKYIADYAKGDNGRFEQLIGQLPQAIIYSQRVFEVAQANNTDNPSTLIHVLVEYLQNLGKTIG